MFDNDGGDPSESISAVGVRTIAVDLFYCVWSQVSMVMCTDVVFDLNYLTQPVFPHCNSRHMVRMIT